MSQDLTDGALAFHGGGKLSIKPGMLLTKQRSYALAYFLGVYFACKEYAEGAAEVLKCNECANPSVMNSGDSSMLSLSSPDIILDSSANERGVLNMTGVAFVGLQTRFIKHDIARVLGAQAG